MTAATLHGPKNIYQNIAKHPPFLYGCIWGEISGSSWYFWSLGRGSDFTLLCHCFHILDLHYKKATQALIGWNTSALCLRAKSLVISCLGDWRILSSGSKQWRCRHEHMRGQTCQGQNWANECCSDPEWQTDLEMSTGPDGSSQVHITSKKGETPGLQLQKVGHSLI